jgi:membrane fusion protein (multidrug efflux system)
MPDDVSVIPLRGNSPSDPRPDAIEPPVTQLYKRLGIPILAVGIALACVLIVAVDWNSWVAGAASQTTDDAFVDADVSTLSAQVSGTIQATGFDDFQTVSKGKLLAEIDDGEYDAAVLVADANLASAIASVENLANQIELQKAVIQAAIAQRSSAVAQLTQAKQEFNRQSNLGGATSEQLLQKAHASYLEAEASMVSSEASIEQQKAQLKVLTGQYPLLNAQADAAKGNLATAKIRKTYTKIHAPFEGVVGRKLVHDGDLVNPGTGIVSLISLPSIHVIANFKETQLAHMKPGGVAEISVDSFPGQRLVGVVTRLSPASGSIYALLPPDNATGNYTKVVQRVPVRIDLNPNQPLAPELKPGMSVVVTVETPADQRR